MRSRLYKRDLPTVIGDCRDRVDRWQRARSVRESGVIAKGVTPCAKLTYLSHVYNCRPTADITIEWPENRKYQSHMHSGL